jgi:hypothetical protein
MAIHASKGDFREAFAGLVFPTSKTAVLNRARLKGGIDREVQAVLSELPASVYRSMEELEGAVRAVYLAHGAEEKELPI